VQHRGGLDFRSVASRRPWRSDSEIKRGGLQTAVGSSMSGAIKTSAEGTR